MPKQLKSSFQFEKVAKIASILKIATSLELVKN